ncbi:uncharacterized protein MAM_02493 [Metarhizium album ARSEF 1941]|uniref:C2H2 type zinc finger domain protein n=1 Tax=Metarhizium album (strain ARSEF 1941) TaxID=1081103 RepID=A0A0B2X2W6_METAS|nr:uncharacterized protein MAM_02493 [Metarhizium album ARSEF 1941]KHN99640.1 hypothetical protein MAM_02493 [Metarhizium album ARSEF 1941]
MAANMQQMAGAGQMIPQQLRRPPANSHHMQQMVYQNLLQHSQPPNGLTWQGTVSLNDRMGKTMDLISNIALGYGMDHLRAAEVGCNFERDVFSKSPTKEAYDQTMASKTLEFFKKRQANEPNIQNNLNANAQAQVQAQAQAQAQAMMNMQAAQMGRGMSQVQQGFQHLQHQVQPGQLPQQAQQHPQLAQQQQLGMGRAMGPAQQAMAMQSRQPQQFPNDMSRLAQSDRAKVMDLAAKMMAQASEQQKASTRMSLQQRLSPQQMAEFQAQGKDPLVLFFQNQAFQVLKSNMNRLQAQQQAGAQNQNGGQAAAAVMMQQQHSQQSFQQRQNMMNAGQPNDFSQFTPNMESIKDQQMTGLMAQQAGQMVVPASSGGAQHATPQPGNPNMPGAQGQNQAPRQGQQQQPPQGGVSLQQMKMNQAVQQSQNQLQQMKMQQQQNQQNGMAGGMPPSQSPAMNTLNTPVSRPPGGMNPMSGQGIGQGNVPFGDQRFNQGTQRPNNQAFNNMLANMSPEQRQALQGLPHDKLNEILRKWQSQRQEQMAMNAGQMGQQHRPPSQFPGQMNLNMGAVQGAQNLQQPNGGMPVNQAQQAQQQMQMPRIPIQNNQTQAMMDTMDLPPHVQNIIGQLPMEVKKWRDLKIWLNQNSHVPSTTRTQLSVLQQRQFQVLMHRRAQQQAGQNPNVNAAMMPNAGGQMPNQQQMGMQRLVGNVPPHLSQVTPQELMQVRNQRPNLNHMSDEQLQSMVLQLKRQAFFSQQQQAQQIRNQQTQVQTPNQTPNQVQQQTGGTQNRMGVAPVPVQQTPPHPNPTRTPQSQTQPSPATLAQTASIQSAGQRQQGQVTNTTQGRINNQSQPTSKNLKRPSTDDVADTTTTTSNTSTPAPTRPISQPSQQMSKGMPTLTPQQIAALSPEQRAKYEQIMKLQLTGQAAPDLIARLQIISQEELRQFSQESMPEISMTAQELGETGAKLQRIAQDVYRVGRGLTKWYSITRDDARAKMFFRTRLRIMKQFSDAEVMKKLKDKFSISSTEVDQARAILGSMVQDLAVNMQSRGMMKPGPQASQGQGAGQSQGAQPQPQQQAQQQRNQQSQPAPLNAANLEKNSQALKNQQKSASKGGASVPPAPTAAQPPFSFGASSPHGNPSYIGKPKDMNLHLPSSRKKQKVSGQQPGQTPQGATPSPKTAKNASPEMRRQEPPKPVFLCREPECEMGSFGFPSDQALQQHVEEEHTKPREDPVRFVKENLALALGLEPDGSPKKNHKPADGATATSLSTSKQGQTPKNAAGTPLPQDNAMKRTGSALSKSVDGKSKLDPAGPKQSTTPGVWDDCTIDPQALLNNLGFENGLPNVVSDANLYRSLTPKDTPESSKDSGSSEPNSDISEGAALEIDMTWQAIDTDLLLDLDNASLVGDLSSLDPTLLLDPPSRPPPDWDNIEVDFSKPLQLDMSMYSMST